MIVDSVSGDPIAAAISIGVIGVVGLIVQTPKPVRVRVVAGLLVAFLLAVGVSAQQVAYNVAFPPLDCCENWWVWFYICVPKSWGWC